MTSCGEYYCYNRKRYVDPAGDQERSVERFQRDFGYKDDVLVCIEGGVGTSVYKQGESVPIWYDCDEVPGEFVGILRKEGRRYVIRDAAQEVERSFGKLREYASRNRLQDTESFSMVDDVDDARVCALETLQKACKEHFSSVHARGGCLHINRDNKVDHNEIETGWYALRNYRQWVAAEGDLT
jgi:hypothetical protein